MSFPQPYAYIFGTKYGNIMAKKTFRDKAWGFRTMYGNNIWTFNGKKLLEFHHEYHHCVSSVF